MQTCNLELPLDRHVIAIHGDIFPKVKILVLDQIHFSCKGGDWNKLLLQRELSWITFKLTFFQASMRQSTFKPFLEGFTSGGMEQ